MPATELNALLVELGIQDGGLQRDLVSFWKLLIAENEVQNLTRLTSPKDFAEGHLLDCLELIKTGWLASVKGPILDLGSGGGVPGIPLALIERAAEVQGGVRSPRQWILAESERMKADFLGRALEALGLHDKVDVFAGRAEDYLKTAQDGPYTIVTRAVGTVQKIVTWIEQSSTWNNLILFKGPNWDVEAQEFQRGRLRKRLQVQKTHSYEVGLEKKQRKIIFMGTPTSVR